MQPYQQASEEHNKQSYRPFQAASSLAIPAIKVGIGGKIMNMINKYIPEDLAMKGLSKIDPRLGKFANLASESGHSFDEIKSFISKKVEKAGQQEIAKQNLNIIEQESPELFKFLDQEIRNGREPIEAAALAQNDKRFSDIIKKLMKTHKTPWSSIIESIFGTGKQALANDAMNPPNSTPNQPLSAEAQAARQSVQQPGQGQAALLAILQKIQQARGGGQ